MAQDENPTAEFEVSIEALVDRARERALDDETVSQILSEVARKLRGKKGPVV